MTAQPAVDAEYFEGFENIQGINIGYCRYGHGPNYILTICGAVGCYAKDWPIETLRHFNPEFYTVVAIDPPGYGKSRPPERKQEITRCSKDSVFCFELMKNLNLLPFTVIGWSEGARTAVHVAYRASEKVVGLVMMAATTRFDKRGTDVMKGMKNTDSWMPADRAPYLKHYTNDFLKKQWAEMTTMIQECYEILGGRFPCDALLPKITCPSLVMHSKSDWFCGDQKQITNMLHNSRLETHLTGSHDFQIKNGKWVAEKVTAFIEDIKSS